MWVRMGCALHSGIRHDAVEGVVLMSVCFVRSGMNAVGV